MSRFLRRFCSQPAVRQGNGFGLLGAFGATLTLPAGIMMYQYKKASAHDAGVIKEAKQIYENVIAEGPFTEHRLETWCDQHPGI